jgi:hypothetical protein
MQRNPGAPEKTTKAFRSLPRKTNLPQGEAQKINAKLHSVEIRGQPA